MDQWFRGSREEGIAAQARQMMRGKEPGRLKQEVDKYNAKVLLQILGSIYM
jgi:hypothetical protein